MQQVGLVDSGQPAGPPTLGSTSKSNIRIPGVHPGLCPCDVEGIWPRPKIPTILGIRDAPPPGLRGFSNANSRGGGLFSITVGSPPTHSPQAGEECLVIDMPKTELNALFVDLANDGFFKSPSVNEGEAHLEVVYNQGVVDKVWSRETHLEQLVDLLKRHGTPTVAQQPSGPLPGYYTGRELEKCEPARTIGSSRFSQASRLRPNAAATLRQSAMILAKTAGVIDWSPSLTADVGSG